MSDSKRVPRDGIPVGKVSRTAVLGVTAAKIGQRKLGVLAKRPFLSRESFRALQARHDSHVAALLFDGLSRLRGSALKVAQFLSLELGLLSEAQRKEFYKAHSRVPPLNRAVVRQLLIAEFGAPPEAIFAAFDATAYAAASLGQVHEARSRAGERLAVKVQYPGIDAALRSDMEMLRRFVLPLFATGHVADMVREIEARFCEEVDYTLERRNTQWFHDHVRIAGVVIPRTFEEYSSGRVLTTEFLDGVHVDQWLAAGPSQAQRDRVAQLIYDFFVCSLFEFHRIHADPNPGNYLFREDGTVAVLDFGSVKIFAPDVCRHLLKLWRASIRGDLDAIVDGYCAFGLANGDRKLVQEACAAQLAPFGEWMSTPFQSDVFDFGEHPDFCERGARLFSDVLTFKEMSGFTVEPVLFYRNIYGLFRIFTILGARVRMRNQWAY